MLHLKLQRSHFFKIHHGVNIDCKNDIHYTYFISLGSHLKANFWIFSTKAEISSNFYLLFMSCCQTKFAVDFAISIYLPFPPMRWTISSILDLNCYHTLNLPTELRFRLQYNPTKVVEEVSQILMIQKVKMLSLRHNGLNPSLLSLIWGWVVVWEWGCVHYFCEALMAFKIIVTIYCV